MPIQYIIAAVVFLAVLLISESGRRYLAFAFNLTVIGGLVVLFLWTIGGDALIDGRPFKIIASVSLALAATGAVLAAARPFFAFFAKTPAKEAESVEIFESKKQEPRILPVENKIVAPKSDRQAEIAAPKPTRIAEIVAPKPAKIAEIAAPKPVAIIEIKNNNDEKEFSGKIENPPIAEEAADGLKLPVEREKPWTWKDDINELIAGIVFRANVFLFGQSGAVRQGRIEIASRKKDEFIVKKKNLDYGGYVIWAFWLLALAVFIALLVIFINLLFGSLNLW